MHVQDFLFVPHDPCRELNKAVKIRCTETFVRSNYAEQYSVSTLHPRAERLCYWLLHLAPSSGRSDIAKELVTQYGFTPAYVDCVRSLSVHEATCIGQIDMQLLTKISKSLLDSENVCGYMSLLLASGGGHLDIVLFFITKF